MLGTDSKPSTGLNKVTLGVVLMKKIISFLVLAISVSVLFIGAIKAQGQMETLSRGIIAINMTADSTIIMS